MQRNCSRSWALQESRRLLLFRRLQHCRCIGSEKGKCSTHGGGSKKFCKVEGCTTFVQAHGVCIKHGAFGTCQGDGCTTNACRRGLPCCCIHGGGKSSNDVECVRSTSCTKSILYIVSAYSRTRPYIPMLYKTIISIPCKTIVFFFSVCVTACSTHNCHWVGQEKAMVGRMWLYDLVRLVRLVRYQT